MSANLTFIPPEKEYFPNYVVSRLLSPEECTTIIDENRENLKNAGFATVGNGDNNRFHTDLDYRTVKSVLLDKEQFNWLYEKLHKEIIECNKIWQFDLTCINEELQLLEYTPGNESIPAGHYNWHQDFGGGYSSLRKMSVVINLTDPKEYEGCRLQVFTHDVYAVAEIEQGTMITFPSWLPHQVTNIESGTRHALVTWITGPRFR